MTHDHGCSRSREIGRFFKEEKRTIVALTVAEILDEEIAHKLAWCRGDERLPAPASI